MRSCSMYDKDVVVGGDKVVVIVDVVISVVVLVDVVSSGVLSVGA